MARRRPAARITTGFTFDFLQNGFSVYRSGRHQHPHVDGARRRMVKRRNVDGALVGRIGDRTTWTPRRRRIAIRSQLHLDLQCRVCGTDVEDQLGDDLGVRQRDVERGRAVPGQLKYHPKHDGDGGTPQSATVNTAFGTALQAVVTNGSNNPLSGVPVTFTALGPEPARTFADRRARRQSPMPAASRPRRRLTANRKAGSYAVTASAAGATTAASFSLTNLAGQPASEFTATAGALQSAKVERRSRRRCRRR